MSPEAVRHFQVSEQGGQQGAIRDGGGSWTKVQADAAPVCIHSRHLRPNRLPLGVVRARIAHKGVRQLSQACTRHQ